MLCFAYLFRPTTEGLRMWFKLPIFLQNMPQQKLLQPLGMPQTWKSTSPNWWVYLKILKDVPIRTLYSVDQICIEVTYWIIQALLSLSKVKYWWCHINYNYLGHIWQQANGAFTILVKPINPFLIIELSLIFMTLCTKSYLTWENTHDMSCVCEAQYNNNV